MIDASETFDGTWPFAPRFSEASGFKQHYVDEGSQDAEVVLCLHGEPTWGYLYRKMIGPLSEKFRVVVPDHMGFGKSETPQDRLYTSDARRESRAFCGRTRLARHNYCLSGLGGTNGGGFYREKPGEGKAVVHC